MDVRPSILVPAAGLGLHASGRHFPAGTVVTGYAGSRICDTAESFDLWEVAKAAAARATEELTGLDFFGGTVYDEASDCVIPGHTPDLRLASRRPRVRQYALCRICYTVGRSEACPLLGG